METEEKVKQPPWRHLNKKNQTGRGTTSLEWGDLLPSTPLTSLPLPPPQIWMNPAHQDCPNGAEWSPTVPSLGEPGQPLHMSSLWLWRTSSGQHDTCQCVNASTWLCHSAWQRRRSKSGFRTEGQNGRNKIPELMAWSNQETTMLWPQQQEVAVPAHQGLAPWPTRLSHLMPLPTFSFQQQLPFPWWLLQQQEEGPSLPSFALLIWLHFITLTSRRIQIRTQISLPQLGSLQEWLRMMGVELMQLEGPLDGRTSATNYVFSTSYIRSSLLIH